MMLYRAQLVPLPSSLQCLPFACPSLQQHRAVGVLNLSAVLVINLPAMQRCYAMHNGGPISASAHHSLASSSEAVEGVLALLPSFK